MTVYNFGSINLDHVYQVPHFVRPGETMASQSYQQLLGGKGANQSVALAKAGAHVVHVGAVHRSNQAVIDELKRLGVDTHAIESVDVMTGHAIIQINADAENAIILYPGANHSLTESRVDAVLSQVTTSDWVLLQNETSQVAYTIQKAHAKHIKVAFNPAPMDVELTRSLLDCIDLLIVNEVEAMDLMQVSNIEDAKVALQQTYPNLAILMTLGSQGVRYIEHQSVVEVEAFKVVPVDTTAAGDTFIGFCLAALHAKLPLEDALKRACAASAICVTRMGAVPAIPDKNEVNIFLAQHTE